MSHAIGTGEFLKVPARRPDTWDNKTVALLGKGNEMRVVVWGTGVFESRMLWEQGEATSEAASLAETLSLAWEDVEGPSRWAVEIECPDPDDVLRLVEETSADDSVLGWSPAPREVPTSWFTDDPFRNLEI